MHVTLVDVNVKPEHVDQFIEACRLNHESSIAEAGNFRFDILQSAENSTHFILYESYRTEEDIGAHKKTQHYLSWRETVADWMAAPRKGCPYRGLFPND